MNYRGKKIAITGADGFIGSALLRALAAEYKIVYADSQEPVLVGSKFVIVKILDGDIRDRRTFEQLDHSYDYLFHFAAPSSQVQFKRMPSYCIQTTLTGFMNAATAAKRHGIRLVYPSTGLLSMGEVNEYARCKKICEDYAAAKNMDAIGLRIFATYGPGEGHKRDYASVPYLFARDMIDRKAPVIFGDGKQVRDFIYIDDVVQAILILAEECPDPVIDVGTGEQVSFNNIVILLNQLLLSTHDPLGAIYVDRPTNYVKETAADPMRLHTFYRPKLSFKKGTENIIKKLKEYQ